MKFVLILTLFGFEAPDYAYVIDYNMSGMDCIERLQAQNNLLLQTFHVTDFNLSCEIDHADELNGQIESLTQRADAIMSSANGLKKWITI